MKFRLSSLVLLLTCICLLIGWVWERQYFEHKLDAQIDEQVSIECALSSALYKNIFCMRLDELDRGEKSPEEFAVFRDRSLVNSVVYLYLNQNFVVDKRTDLGNGWTHNAAQTERSLDFAGCALKLLEFVDERALQQYFQNNPSFAESFGDELFDANGQMKPDFVAFVNQAIERYRDQRPLEASSAG